MAFDTTKGLFTFRGKIAGRMTRISRCLIVGEMTLDAAGCDSCVIERGSLPRHCVVACLTIGGKVASNVIRILRRLVVGHVTGNACVRKSGKDPTGMTGGTCSCQMSACKRKP
jgi:hypothetical protein